MIKLEIPFSIWTLFCFSLVSTLSMASEEEHAPWRSVTIEFGSLGEAGNVKLSAKTGKKGIESFQASAFTRSYTLAETDLEKLRLFPLQGLTVTHESGYARTGGYCVYFKLSRLFIDPKTNHTLKENAMIRVQRKGDLSVSIHRSQ